MIIVIRDLWGSFFSKTKDKKLFSRLPSNIESAVLSPSSISLSLYIYIYISLLSPLSSLSLPSSLSLSLSFPLSLRIQRPQERLRYRLPCPHFFLPWEANNVQDVLADTGQRLSPSIAVDNVVKCTYKMLCVYIIIYFIYI